MQVQSIKENHSSTLGQKVIKQQFEFRHKNLTCPHKHYHMKVHFRDLEQFRPSCPACGSPMLVKEELKEVVNGNYTISEVVEDSNIKAYLV